MNFRTSLRAGLTGLALATLTAGVALAQAPATPPVPNKGDVAFMMSSTILVLLILNLHRTTATRTRRPFVGNLTNIIIGLDRTTTATGRTDHTLGISGITGIMRRLRNRQLRLFE